MKFRCAGIVQNSSVDGLGLRMAIFFQGCAHFCKDCQNQHTWDFQGGYETDTDIILKAYVEDELLSGITLTGGDPLYQPIAAYDISRRVHQHGGNVWCYTGFTYDELKSSNSNDIKKLLVEIDILVDGPFIVEQKDPDLLWRGSDNQQILKLKNGIIEEVLTGAIGRSSVLRKQGYPY